MSSSLTSGALLSRRARGLVVMIVACQVIDPGSIPGERTVFFVAALAQFGASSESEKQVWPSGQGVGFRRQSRKRHGFEPRNLYFCSRQWCIGNIEASQALAPGSTPGWRTFVTCILGRVVKALDLSPSGLSPRGFEPRRMHFF